MKNRSKHSYRFSTIFGKIRINIEDLKSFIRPNNVKLYPVPYRYVFLYLLMFWLLLHILLWFYVVLFVVEQPLTFHFLCTRTLFYGFLLLFCELYLMTLFRADNAELPLSFYVFYHRISPLLLRLDILLDCFRILYHKYTYNLKLKIKISGVSIFFLGVKYRICHYFRLLISFYKWLIFVLFYHNLLYDVLKLFYFLERTKIKVFIVDVLNIFGFNYPRYVLPTIFREYWSIPGLSFYFFKFFSKYLVLAFVFIKNLIFTPFFDVVNLAMTPHEVHVRDYPIINAFYDANNTTKESLIGNLLFNPLFKSKKFYTIYTAKDVKIHNITSIFTVVPLHRLKRLYERCCLLLGVKYNVFPFNLNTVVPYAFYRFYVSYSFYTKLHNFDSFADYIKFLYNLLFKSFKINTSAWYLNYIVKQREHFFKYEFFRDQLFFYTTYKGTGEYQKDYARDEFKLLGLDDDNLEINVDREDFEAAYRSFLPRELIYMGDLDYLFPDIGSYNRMTLVREAFYRSFSQDVNILRQDISSPYRNMIHKYTRVHWLKLITYQRMCQDDLRDYQQQVELDCLFNTNIIYHDTVFKTDEPVETLSDFYFKMLDTLRNFVLKFSYLKIYIDSIFLNKYNIDHTLLNINSKILNYIVRKQHTQDVYLRTLIYEFSLKREASYLQKLLSKPLFDRVLEEDLLYTDYYKAFSSYVEHLNYYYLQWCPNYYEDFMANYALLAREKMRNSFLALITAYILKNKVSVYNFNLSSILVLEGSFFLKLFNHKKQGFALLLHFNLYDFFNLLKYFFFGFFILIRLFLKNKKNIEYIQFKEVFYYDLFLFVLLIPRYLLNIFIFLLSKLRTLFFISITVYSFFYGAFLMIIENKGEHIINIFLLPYWYWGKFGFNLGYPFLPMRHEKWCEAHNIDFDIYYNLLAIPTMIIWYVVTMYNFMYVRYVQTFPMTPVQIKKDSYMATDEDDRLIDGAIFRRVHEGFTTQADFETLCRADILRENAKDEYLDDVNYEDLFDNPANDSFGVVDNKSLFKEEFQPLDPYRDEEELYALFNKGVLGITSKEFDYYADDDLFEQVFDEAWVLQNDLDSQEYYKRNYGDFFYDTPRKLSSQIEERFSFLFSKTLKYERLLSFGVIDVEKEYINYMDMLEIYQSMDRDVDYWSKIFIEKINFERKAHIAPHASVFM